MIGLDTNLLLRYIVQDDETQSSLAINIIDQYAGHKHSIFLNNIVICELVWVLERGYKYSRVDICNVIRHILSAIEFSFENHDILWLSLSDYENTKSDFSDALIGKINVIKYHCTKTITFDQGTISLKEFERV